MAGSIDQNGPNHTVESDFPGGALLNAIDEPFYAVDLDEQLVAWNERFLDITGYEASEAQELELTDFLAAYTVDNASGPVEHLQTEGRAIIEGHLETKEGLILPYEFRERPLLNEEGDFIGRCGTGRELDSPHPISDTSGETVGRITDYVLAITDKGVVTYANAEATEFLDVSYEDLIGCRFVERFPALTACASLDDHISEVLATQERKSVTAHHDPRDMWLEIRFFPSPTGVTLIAHDITDRKKREQQRKTAERRLEALFQDPWTYLGITDIDGTVLTANEKALEVVETTLDEEQGKKVWDTPWFDVQDVPNEKAKELVDVVLDGTASRYEAEATIPSGEDLHVDIVVRPVTDNQGDVVSVLFEGRDITKLKDQEAKLQRRGAEIEHLNRVNSVIRETTQELVRAGSRDEMEHTVCEVLSQTGLYDFVFIGELKLSTSTVEPTASAGAKVDDFDSMPISLTVDDPVDPISQALVANEIQVVRNGDASEHLPLWSDKAVADEWQTAAVVPITYESSKYGVLVLYLEQADGFEAEEAQILAELGDTIGYTIYSLSHERAVIGHPRTELELLAKSSGEWTHLPADSSVTISSAIRVDSDRYLSWGETDGLSPAEFEAVVERVESLAEWAQLDSDTGAGHHRYQFIWEDSQLLSTLVNLDAVLTRVTLRSTGIHIKLELPKGRTPREALDTVRGIFPRTTILQKRSTARSEKTASEYQHLVDDLLTERQRTILEVAYFSGYFERPREMNKTELADVFEISDSTINEHLSVAQRKLCKALFESKQP